MRTPQRAHCGIAEREADSHVALHRHGGQVERGVLGGEDSSSHQQAAYWHVDGEKYKGADEEGDSDEELDHVVEHQVDEEHVAGVFSEDLRVGKKY